MNTADIANGNLAALLAGIVPPTTPALTGEPCRCLESVLDCQCGAYENEEA